MIANYTPRDEFLGTGAQTQFAFDFLITQLADLLIVVTDQNFNPILSLRGTDTVNLSSVTFNQWGGGFVNFITAPAINYNVTLLLAPDMPTQQTQFRDQGDFTLTTFEHVADYAISAIQRLSYSVQRALRIGDNLLNAQPFNMQLPINSTNPATQNNAGMVPMVNSANSGWVMTPYINPPNVAALETVQPIIDNQAAPLAIAGLTFASGSISYAEVMYTIYRYNGVTEYIETGKIQLQWSPVAQSWSVVQRTATTDALQMGAGSLSVQTVVGVGQLYYQSNLIGQTVGQITWKYVSTMGAEAV